MIYKMRGLLGHSSTSATRTETATFAAQAHDVVVLAVRTSQEREPMRKHAAFQECAQLFLDELRHAHAIVRIGGGAQKRRQVLLEHAEQHALLGVAALVYVGMTGGVVETLEMAVGVLGADDCGEHAKRQCGRRAGAASL